MSEFHYGGQAVIEGVMMRGQRYMAVAVRTPKGEIVVHSEPLASRVRTHPVAKWPFVRGLLLLWDTLTLGIRSLMFSADVAMSEVMEEAEMAFSGPLAWGTLILGLGLGVGIFFVGPLLLTSLVDRYIHSALLSNLVEGLIRLGLVLGYIWSIGFIPDIKRVFAYHGAEHKTIMAFEDGAPLEPETVRRYTTVHPRCGTAFLLVVVVLAVLVFALLGRPSLWLRILSRVLLIPVIAGVAYELIRFSADHRSHPLVRAIFAPSLALQKLTTREPDEGMLEVAITALRRVLEADKEAEVAEDTGGHERYS